MTSRPKVGDVIEIPTQTGFAYAQYSHWNDRYGELIRVLPGVHKSRPTRWESLVGQPEVFSTFTPLAKAVRDGHVSVVASVPVPSSAQSFPLMRAPGLLDASGNTVWWLWDGKQEWRTPQLTAEQQRLSIREIVGLSVIADRVLNGWNPVQEV